MTDDADARAARLVHVVTPSHATHPWSVRCQGMSCEPVDQSRDGCERFASRARSAIAAEIRAAVAEARAEERGACENIACAVGRPDIAALISKRGKP